MQMTHIYGYSGRHKTSWLFKLYWNVTFMHLCALQFYSELILSAVQQFGKNLLLFMCLEKDNHKKNKNVTKKPTVDIRHTKIFSSFFLWCSSSSYSSFFSATFSQDFLCCTFSQTSLPPLFFPSAAKYSSLQPKWHIQLLQHTHRGK